METKKCRKCGRIFVVNSDIYLNRPEEDEELCGKCLYRKMYMEDEC